MIRDRILSMPFMLSPEVAAFQCSDGVPRARCRAAAHILRAFARANLGSAWTRLRWPVCRIDRKRAAG